LEALCTKLKPSMFRDLLHKVITFSQLYETQQDISLLTDCENVPQYKEILKALNRFNISDLLLDEKTIQESFVPGCITAATILESPKVSIGYFFLPAGTFLSPHDHPGMLVTSKVLMGTVKRRAWDLVDRDKQFELPTNSVYDIEDNPFSGIRLDAILETDELCEEGEMINLTPLTGNVHSFTAIKDTIIFDILTPYYDQETRFCNFYLEVDNYLPSFKSKLIKKVKREVSETDKTKKGYKTTLVYLQEAPKIDFKIVECNPEILRGPPEKTSNGSSVEAFTEVKSFS